MQFNSYIFILIFFPIVFLIYSLLAKSNKGALRKLVVIMSGGCFYLYCGLQNAYILLASIVFNIIAIIIMNRISAKFAKRIVLVAAILLNVLLLLYYKYFNFIIINCNTILGSTFKTKDIIVPLGISFFTFQQIMYLVNEYRNKLSKRSCVDYLSYILFFPGLIMGPLFEPEEFFCQFNDKTRKITIDRVVSGIQLFSFGLFKKVILADTFAIAVNWGFENDVYTTSLDMMLVMLSYTFQIYFDFSGYTDMATGVAKMLGIDLPINFNSPYKAISIRDFWKRWHMSLTGFLTRYIYIPLGGSKCGNIKIITNTLIVFLISGIWHGANWTFIVWGLIHGVLSLLDRYTNKYKESIPEGLRRVTTFGTISILWLLFRSEGITQWFGMLKKMIGCNEISVSTELINCFQRSDLSFIIRVLQLDNVVSLGFYMILFIIVGFWVCFVPENNYNKSKNNTMITAIMAALAFVFSFLCLSRESVFIYNNF